MPKPVPRRSAGWHDAWRWYLPGGHLDNSNAAQTLVIQKLPRVKPFCWRLENSTVLRVAIVRFSCDFLVFASFLENS